MTCDKFEFSFFSLIPGNENRDQWQKYKKKLVFVHRTKPYLAIVISGIKGKYTQTLAGIKKNIKFALPIKSK